MQLDEIGIDFLRSLEGFSALAYLDQHGVWTIGWGHTDGVNEWTPGISEGQAELLLEQDLEEPEAVVMREVEVPLTQNEFTALVTFVFNVGVPKFLHGGPGGGPATLLIKLNAGDKQGAAKEFGKWIYYHDPVTHLAKVSEGLVARRAKEAALFLSDLQTTQKLAQL